MSADIVIGIVEDNIIIADSIEKALTELGYRVLPPANTFDEAVDMITSRKPDLVILDIILGKGHDGIDLATKINKEYHVPFIYLTANADKPTIERAKITLPAAFLIKPFTKNDLYASIEIAIIRFHHDKQDSIASGITFIKDGNAIRKIRIQDIMYLQADHVYLNIHTLHRRFFIRASLQNFLEQVKCKNILMVHRSYAVNIEHIAEIRTRELIVNGKEIPVSRTHKNILLAAVKDLG